MRPANCRKLCWNTPCPLSRRMMAGSKVTPSSAAEIAWRETPCDAASCLKAASQASKLPVLRQRGSLSRTRQHCASTAAPITPHVHCRIAAAPGLEKDVRLCHPTGWRQVGRQSEFARGRQAAETLDLDQHGRPTRRGFDRAVCAMMASSMRPIRKAIFPVAGLGTRFLPATKAMPKEMLPVVDRPLIQHVVDEAREAGIEHFIFVTGRNKAVIEDHFDRQFELELTLKERNKLADLKLLSADLPEPGTTSFTRQQSPLGLGHAVWCARELIRDEPFALLLPDVLVQHSPGCLKQMIEASERAGGERQHHRGGGGSARPHPSIWRRRRRQDQGQDLLDHRDGGEAHARESAVEPDHHRPLYPAAGNLRVARDPGGRRRRRNPDHRCDDQARQEAAVLRPEIRGPQLRLRLEGRLSGRQRRLCAAAAGHRAGIPRRNKAAPRATETGQNFSVSAAA